VKTVARKIRTRWQSLGLWTRWTLLTLLVLVVAARAALPYAVKHYVNQQLNKIPEYRGRVAKIDVQLIRGAYKIRGLEIEKATGPVPVPFLSVPEVDLSMQWKELFHGSLVGEVVVNRPQINFVNAPSESEKQTGVGKEGQRTLESLFPFNLNRFQVNNGNIRFRDFHREPKVDIYVTNLFATATNLTNSREVNDKLPAGLVARGKTIGGGEFELLLRLNPLKKDPTFELTAGITNMDLTALNSFMRAYGKFDVQSGQFQVYTEIAAADGRFEGYVKPFFQNLDIFDWDKERKKGILQKFWQAIVAGVGGLFKNQPQDQLATRIPLSGNFEQTDINLWATIGGILRNAFVRALLPNVERSVDVEDVESNSDSRLSETSSRRTKESGKTTDDTDSKPSKSDK
jgi:hypothetical protein